jgi:glucokinase-like ROK family protein
MPVSELTLSADEITILKTVFWSGSPSRHALQVGTKFSKSKLNAIVSNLIAQGWLNEGEQLGSSGGRPANGIGLSTQLGYLIGIDLGATSLQIALTDPNLSIRAQRQTALDVRAGPGTIMPLVSKFIAELLEECELQPRHLLGIGFGVPAPVAFENSMLMNPILMAGWDGFSLRDYFASSLEVPVIVDNDANVMALGELWYARTMAASNVTTNHTENFIVLKLGTGIGAGIIAHGELHRGADGAAGDVGHNCVDPGGERCSCGNFGCLELYAGAPAITRAATRAAQSGSSPSLARQLAQNGQITTFDVSLASRDGDPAAIAIVQEAGSRIGQVLAGMVNFFNPSRVILGGGIAQLGPLMLSSIRQSIYARSLPLSTRALRIDLTRLEETAGVHGAAALALLHAIEQAAQ